MEILRKYEGINETRDTLISLYFHEQLKENVLNSIQKELHKYANIQNSSIKNKLNTRLYSLKQKIEKMNDESIINSIFLLGNDIIIEHTFTENEKHTLKEYHLKSTYIENNNHFNIDYFYRLLYDFNFYILCSIVKNTIHFYKLNSTKNKEICVNKILNEKTLIEDINTFIINHKINELYIHTNTNYYKCLSQEKNAKIICFDQSYSNEEMLGKIKGHECEKNNIYLEKKLNELNNPHTNLDLFVFGRLKKEILESIECFSLKELYIEERKLTILKQCLDDSYFNFKIIPIVSLKEGDSASKFIEDYKGLMGVKYF